MQAEKEEDNQSSLDYNSSKEQENESDCNVISNDLGDKEK